MASAISSACLICVSIKAALPEKQSELFLILYLSNVSYVHIVKCTCVCAQNIPVGTVKWIYSKKGVRFL